MDEIISNLFIGGSDDHKKMESGSLALNVALDLNIIDSSFKEYHKIGLIDGPGNSVDSFIACVFLLKSLRDRYPDKKLLIHCHGGSSRSVIVVALYLVAFTEIQTLQEALDFIQSKRDEANPCDALIRLAEKTLISLRGFRIYA